MPIAWHFLASDIKFQIDNIQVLDKNIHGEPLHTQCVTCQRWVCFRTLLKEIAEVQGNKHPRETTKTRPLRPKLLNIIFLGLGKFSLLMLASHISQKCHFKCIYSLVLALFSQGFILCLQYIFSAVRMCTPQCAKIRSPRCFFLFESETTVPEC